MVPIKKLLYTIVTTVGPTHRATRTGLTNINTLVVATGNTKTPLF